MCGRFALGIPKKRLEEVFGLSLPDAYASRYNVAPGTDVLAVTGQGAGWLRWGLVPHWAKDASMGGRMINARSETVFDKSAFRESVRSARCLVPAQAFYEWKRNGRARQPYVVTLADTDVFAMAGIRARWQDPDTSAVVETMAILTCAPNALMSTIHDRMPVILPPDRWTNWLDPASADPEQLGRLLRPYHASDMRLRPVSSAVNRVENDGPELLDPVADMPQKQGSLL